MKLEMHDESPKVILRLNNSRNFKLLRNKTDYNPYANTNEIAKRNEMAPRT